MSSSELSAETRMGQSEKPLGGWRRQGALNRHRKPLACVLGVLGCAAVAGAILSPGALPKTLLFCAGGFLLFAGCVALKKPKKMNNLVMTVLAIVSLPFGIYSALNEGRATTTPVAISAGAAAQKGCGSATASTPPAPVSGGGEGQIDGGDIFRVLTGPGKSSNIVLANSPSVLTLIVLLYNPGIDNVGPLLVSAPLSTRPTDCWYVTVRTFSDVASPSSTTATLVINVADDRLSTLSYVPGSTVLYNTVGRTTPLPDGITEGGIYVSNGPGEEFNPGKQNVRLVHFNVRLTPVG